MITNPTNMQHARFFRVEPRTVSQALLLSAYAAAPGLARDTGGIEGDLVAVNAEASWTASGNVVLIGVTNGGHPVLAETSTCRSMVLRCANDRTPRAGIGHANQPSF